MMRDHPDFEFKFRLAGDFKYVSAANDPNVLFSKTTNLQVQMENWTDYFRYLGNIGEERTAMSPEKFVWHIHGDDFNPTAQEELLQNREMDQKISGVKYDENDFVFAIGLPDDTENAHVIGLRTTKDCFQATKIRSVQFIFATKDPEFCKELDQIALQNP